MSIFERSATRLKRLSRIECVVCDLDGTLLRSDNSIGEQTISSVSSAIESGIRVVLASGRTDGFTRAYAKLIGSDAPIVSLNGALVLDSDGNTLHASILPASLRVLVEKLRRDGMSARFSVFTESGIFLDADESHLPRYLRGTSYEIHHLTSVNAIFDQAVLLLFSGSYIDIQKCSVAISRRYLGRLQRIMYQSNVGGDHYYLEVRNGGVSKATGLRTVLQHLGIARTATASIGDYTNDIEMCKFTGVSAAMRNAVEELKAVTDVVTLRSNQNDGVAEFLELILARKASRSQGTP